MAIRSLEAKYLCLITALIKFTNTLIQVEFNHNKFILTLIQVEFNHNKFILDLQVWSKFQYFDTKLLCLPGDLDLNF